MKKLRAFCLLMLFVAICFASAAGIHAFVGHFLDRPAAAALATCNKKGHDHLVLIKNSLPLPSDTTAKLCDTLTIKNTDDQIRLIAFGVHDKHQAYDGIEERALDKDQSFSVVLNRVGTFKFHDHLDDSAQGRFTVR